MQRVKVGLWIIACPFIIIFLLAAALYLPPVQQWAVNIASNNASKATGMDVTVERVRLAFPLDLSIEGVKVVKQDSVLPQKPDTVAYIRRAVVDVQLWPLLQSEVNVNTIEIVGTTINTMDMVPQARVKGNIGRMTLTGGRPVAEIQLKSSEVLLKKAIFDNAHLDIALTDSVVEDTTTTPNQWKIRLEELSLSNSDILLHTPGDTLQVGCNVKSLIAQQGFFDLGKSLYQLSSLRINGTYISYDNTFASGMPKGALDYNHLALNDLNTQIDSLSFNNSDIRLHIKSMAMKERSGLAIKSLNANIVMDSTKIMVEGVLNTFSSNIATQLSMDFNALDTIRQKGDNGRIKARIDATLSKQDIAILLSAASMEDIGKQLPYHPITIKGEAEGNLFKVFVKSLNIEIPTLFSVDANGNAKGFRNLASTPYHKDFTASLHADMKTYQLTPLVRQFASAISVPATHATVDFNIKGADCNVDIMAQEGRGNITAHGKLNIAAMAYDAKMEIERLNISHFLKGAGIGLFTGKASVSGRGTDFLSPKTNLRAKAEVKKCAYGKYDINNIDSDIELKNGRAYATINAHNQLVDGTVQLDALIHTKKLDATLMTEIAYIDFYSLKLVDKPLKLSACSHIDIMSDFRNKYVVQGNMGDIAITDSSKTYKPDDITLDILTDKDTTMAKMYCGDFMLRLNAQGGYKRLAGSTDRLTDVIKQQLANRTIDQLQLRKALPRMSLALHSSKENPIYRFIKYYEMDYDKIDATISTSYEDGINANILMTGIATQGYTLDTVAVRVNSTNEPYAIFYKGYIQNVAPNDYVFCANFDGEVLEHGISVNTILKDADNAIGLRLGAEATMTDEGIKLHLTPETPIIGYEQFKLKPDNFILLDRNNRMFADVSMVSDKGTGIMIYSTDTENNSDALQDITLSINNLDIQRILSAIPYAPQASGMLNGDVHIVQDNEQAFTISSSINTRNLIYEGCTIGDLGTEIVYMPTTDGTHHIDGIMSLNNDEIGTIQGAYNFETSQIDANLALSKFPMQIINGFIPDRIIGLEGFAEGTLSVQGSTNAPLVNGELYLESSSLVSTPYGVKMRFDDDPIRIEDSKLLFENFQMYANNNQPLTAYGSLDFSNPDHIMLDLRMRAENFLLIDSKETKQSEVYGKAYVNFFAYLKGELDKLQVNGLLDVLPTTNIFYILRDSPLSNDNRLKELVTFTNFNAKDGIEITRPTVDGLNINFNVSVKSGSHIKCWLNDARNNYLDIIGDGDLKWRYANDEMTMTGRYTISEGEIKYSLPVIPLKTFVITDGSYIEFTGDMMNPRLNITAKETKKASVNINGTNRMVTFNTGVVLTKTLNDMGLEFVIEAPEDNTVTDELNMKSKEERGKLAVTMLTTGMYLSDGNTSTFSMNSALNSFLQSEISNIAGSALKTLDVSFGMDNSTEEDGTIHTNYSFKFAKRFWNNRLSISVGGKISTGPDVSGQNKSFFDNVELQYRLSDVSNKYTNLFYNRSVYDYLEGYVGQYGGGFLWKKKIQTLNELWKNSNDIKDSIR